MIDSASDFVYVLFFKTNENTLSGIGISRRWRALRKGLLMKGVFKDDSKSRMMMPSDAATTMTINCAPQMRFGTLFYRRGALRYTDLTLDIRYDCIQTALHNLGDEAGFITCPVTVGIKKDSLTS